MSTKTIQYSKEQLAIFAWFAGTLLTEFKNLVVTAYAGVGKTFTSIVGMLEHAPENKLLYLVFANRNKDEALEKIQNPKVEVMTAHAFGRRALVRAWGKVNYGDSVKWVEWNRIKEICPELREKQLGYLVAKLAALIDAAKNVFLYVPSVEEMTKLAISKGCEANDKDDKQFPLNKLVDIAIRSMELAIKSTYWASFGDYIWLPVVLKLHKREYPFVLVDEAQDLNAVQLAIVESVVTETGRMCFVGDSNQSIYTWRGAMVNSMALIAAKYNATELKLSRTFRCGKNIVNEAIPFVGDYVADDSNPDGEVLHKDEDYMIASADIGHAILSRLNAPLMAHALALIRKGKSARIEGKDIGKDLLNVIESIGCQNINAFADALDSWSDVMIAKATGRNASERIELIQDQEETLRVLSESCASIDEMKAKIETLFQMREKGTRQAIVLSSVHKAKGLEWNTVYLLDETFKRSKKAQSPDQVQEEKNVRYVAITRAKERLVYIQ